MPPAVQSFRPVRVARPCWWRVLVAGVLACSLLGACTTTQVVSWPQPGDITQYVKPGDTAKFTLRDNSAITLKVKEVTPEAVTGESHRVFMKDVAKVEVVRFSKGRTALVVVAVAATAGGLAYGLSNMAFFPPMVP